MTYSHEYSSAYYPSAPVAKISVCDTQKQKPKPSMIALLDSGADATMIPLNVLEAIEAEYLERRQVRGVSGFAYPVDTYLVTVQIATYTIYGIKAVAIGSREQAIVGRDVLNQLVVTLNGLAGIVEIEG